MKEQKRFVRIGQAAAVLCVLASTFAADPEAPHYRLHAVWGIFITACALIVGMLLGAAYARAGVLQMIQEMNACPKK
jgi:hypothetical protein